MVYFFQSVELSVNSLQISLQQLNANIYISVICLLTQIQSDRPTIISETINYDLLLFRSEYDGSVSAEDHGMLDWHSNAKWHMNAKLNYLTQSHTQLYLVFLRIQILILKKLFVGEILKSSIQFHGFWCEEYLKQFV